MVKLECMSAILNLSSGLFINPPAEGILKVARHGFGYRNPTVVERVTGEKVTISLPLREYENPDMQVPKGGVEACRKALREIIPELGNRPFERTRVCWYNDTPTGDFLISYHPEHKGLFIATGDSGH